MTLPWLLSRETQDTLSAVRETSLAKLVRDEVMAQILRGELTPGQRINEPDVSQRLKVSRVPVREALRELESSGLVVSRKHAGVFVRHLTPTEIADLYEMRAVLDSFAGRKAATLPDGPRQALNEQLQQSIARMNVYAERRDVQAYYGENLRFHWLIVEAASNHHLTETYRDIVQKLHLMRLQNLSKDYGMRTSIAEHVEIAASLAAGDAAGTQRLLNNHVRDAFTRLNEQT